MSASVCYWVGRGDPQDPYCPECAISRAVVDDVSDLGLADPGTVCVWCDRIAGEDGEWKFPPCDHCGAAVMRGSLDISEPRDRIVYACEPCRAAIYNAGPAGTVTRR
jgi:hypothetical protein